MKNPYREQGTLVNSIPPFACVPNAIKNGSALILKPNQVIETDLAAIAFEGEKPL